MTAVRENRPKPIARCRWSREADKAECLAALGLVDRHGALRRRGFELGPVEAELAACGRLTVQVTWSRPVGRLTVQVTWSRPVGRSGEGLLGRARRRHTLVEEVVANLPLGAAMVAVERFRRRAKLEAVLKRETAEAAA